MNPCSFHVELYHEKISKKQDPRDILIPSSIPSKGRKLHPAITFLGGLTASKAGLVVVGGILAVGCTVRAFRSRRQRLLEKKNASRRGNMGCSRIEVGTQTDSSSDWPGMKGEEIEKDSGYAQLASNLREEAVPVDDFIANKMPSPETHEAPQSTQSKDAEKLDRVCRNISNVTEMSDDNTVSKCDCASKNDATVVTGRAAQLHHSCCHLSAFIALLALHKASMCDRGARLNALSEAKPEGRTTNSNVDNVAKSGTSEAWKPQHSAFSNNDGAQSLKRPDSRGARETPHPANCDARKDEKSGAKVSGLSTSEFRPNPFDLQIQPNRSHTSGSGKQGRPPFKADSSSSHARPSNPAHRFRNNSSSQGSSSNHVAQNTFEQIQEMGNAARSKTNNKRGEGKSSSVTFRPRISEDSEGMCKPLHQRGKQQRRGNAGQNRPRRPYVDLDAP